MIQKIIDFDVPTVFGWKFLYQEMDNIPKIVPCLLDRPGRNDIRVGDKDVFALARIKMDRSGLFAEYKVFQEFGEQFGDKSIQGYTLSPMGVGRIDDNKIYDYNLICLYLNKI